MQLPQELYLGESGGLNTEVEALQAAGLRDDEIARLASLKRRIQTGERGELTHEYKRLLFARYLYETGCLHDGWAGGRPG